MLLLLLLLLLLFPLGSIFKQTKLLERETEKMALKHKRGEVDMKIICQGDRWKAYKQA